MPSDFSDQIVLDGNSLTIAHVQRIARDPQVKIAIDPGAIERVAACRGHIEQIVADYERDLRENKPDVAHVYGVTTGFGEFKDQPVPLDQLQKLQENILLSHSVGVGDNANELDPMNFQPPDVVRAALVMRLNALLKGFSGVRVELVEFIASMINAGIIPLVPTRGSVGSSGDLCPLAHLFVVMLGEGHFYTVKTGQELAKPQADLRRGSELSTAMGCEVPRPSFKEGLALTNGATFSAAILALAVHDAENLAQTADIAAALSLEAVCGRTRAFHDAVHAARNMRGQRDSAGNVRALLAGSQLLDQANSVQDVYSLRCAPQVHGASRDAIAYAKMIAEAEMNAATDNPLFFTEIDRNAFSAGNFHGQPVGIAADVLAIACAELANIAERRTQMLLDKNHNRGLPGNLISNRGVNSGLMLIQYCAASLVSENKVLCHPGSVDSIPTSANTEDHNAMASICARKLRMVVANAQAVLAINLLSAAQAIDWRAGMRIDPNGRANGSTLESAREEAEQFQKAITNRAAIAAQLGAGTRAAYDLIRRHTAPVTRDRVMDEDIRRIRQLVELGGFIDVFSALRPIPALRAVDD